MANPRYNTQTTNRRGAMGGGRMKKMGGGMMKRPMMKNGGSGKLKMVTNKEGKKVPFYAADGVGKMKKGGIAKLNPGLKAYMMKKKKKKGKRNLKAEKKRIVRELKSSGGSAGVALRGKGCEIR